MSLFSSTGEYICFLSLRNFFKTHQYSKYPKNQIIIFLVQHVMLTLLKGLGEISPKCILAYVILILIFVTKVFIARKPDIPVIKPTATVIIQKIAMDTKASKNVHKQEKTLSQSMQDLHVTDALEQHLLPQGTLPEPQILQT